MHKIKQSIKIGNLKLDGRILLPSVATYQCDEAGLVTGKVCEYYGERAKNSHISLIITEHSFIAQQGKAKKNQMSIADDTCIVGLRRLVNAIHGSGAKVFAQINHAGSAAPQEVSLMKPVAPSPVILPVEPPLGDGCIPNELSANEIQQIVTAFANAARRAKDAGYDGVEIHSAHSYLLNQFYSPLTNHRTDEYGGSLQNRLRIHTEVINAVRKEVGHDYPISVRLGGCDYMEGGSTIEDSVIAAKLFEQESVNVLNISGGMCRYTRKGHNEPGYFKDMSSAIKKAVHIPVIVTGGVKTLIDAENLLNEQAADLIGVGRSLLKDPKWEEK
ncbi:MAG: NADH:flavin oxidoreductase [Lachnospiraceae bacterium]|nr:NADH:flavin oxidoreductase [Lachnospiraceae bacterium]MDD3617330.1 NADH:flavin oxidoreductase [Lachnospiraceae bacterium]